MNPEFQRAVSAMRRRRFGEAIPLLAQYLDGHPKDVQARWLLVQSLESAGRRDSALEQIGLLLDHLSNELPAIDRIAEHLRRKGYPLGRVLKAYEVFLGANPDSANAVFNYAYNLAKDGQFESAIKQYRRAIELDIDEPEEVYLNIANIYMDHLDDHDAARENLGNALDLNPKYSKAHYNLGNLAEQEGNRADAISSFEKCLQLDPANDSALARLADTRTISDRTDAVLSELIKTAASSENADIHFALGKALEQLGDFDAAFHHFSIGNSLDRARMPPYKPAHAEDRFNRIKAVCTRTWIEQFGGSSHEAVFICGMFRSGSTLLEQMLAAHPGFHAGGEKEFFPRLVAREFPDYPSGLHDISLELLQSWKRQHLERSGQKSGLSVRMTDKRPDNFLYLGLIKAILPSARFVVTERDWRDIAASIYSVRLGPSQSYATRLEDIRHYIGLQNELIEHWQEILGAELKRIRYEDLVTKPKETLTDVLVWLGEDWDDACLSFHALKNAVKTASVWQVRQPLHPASVGRWKRFSKHFEAAFGSELNT